MFGSKKSPDQEEEFRNALERQDFARASQLAQQVFDDFGASRSPEAEDALAFYTCMLYENDVPDTFKFLSEFLQRFSCSPHLPRVYRADLFARAGNMDQATQDARIYLRQSKDAGAFSKLEEYRIVRFGVTRAFVLVTAAYTELGARSYSKRVLDYAMKLALDPTQEIIQIEYNRLAEELALPENHAIDQKWESFFSSGKYASELHQLAQKRGFSILAKRIDLLEGNFRFNAHYKIDSKEIFQLVLNSKDKNGKEMASLN